MAKVNKIDDHHYTIKLGPKHKLDISVFKNQDDAVVLNLRKFYRNAEDEWRPDKQGLTMHLDQASALRKITKALEEVAEDAPEPDFAKKGKSSGKKSKKRDKDDEDDE